MLDKNVISHGQSGGITAGTVNVTLIESRVTETQEISRLSPLQRMLSLLQNPADWVHNPGNEYLVYDELLVLHSTFPIYHKTFPEFTIELSESERRPGESFCYFYPNESSFWGTASFKYHTTTVFSLDYVYCDEMRILLPVPSTYNLFPADHGAWFYYYLLDDYKGIFLKFIRGGRINFSSGRGEAPFITFKNRDQLEQFIKIAKDCKDEIHAIPASLWPQLHRLGRDDKFYVNGAFISKIQQFYDRYY